MKKIYHCKWISIFSCLEGELESCKHRGYDRQPKYFCLYFYAFSLSVPRYFFLIFQLWSAPCFFSEIPMFVLRTLWNLQTTIWDRVPNDKFSIWFNWKTLWNMLHKIRSCVSYKCFFLPFFMNEWIMPLTQPLIYFYLFICLLCYVGPIFGYYRCQNLLIVQLKYPWNTTYTHFR